METNYKHIIRDINNAFKIIKHINKIKFKYKHKKKEYKQNNIFKLFFDDIINQCNLYIQYVNISAEYLLNFFIKYYLNNFNINLYFQYIKYYLNNFNINLYFYYIDTLSDQLIELLHVSIQEKLHRTNL